MFICNLLGPNWLLELEYKSVGIRLHHLHTFFPHWPLECANTEYGNNNGDPMKIISHWLSVTKLNPILNSAYLSWLKLLFKNITIIYNHAYLPTVKENHRNKLFSLFSFLWLMMLSVPGTALFIGIVCTIIYTQADETIVLDFPNSLILELNWYPLDWL